MNIDPVQALQLLFGTGAALAIGKVLIDLGKKIKEQDQREERLVKIEKAQDARATTDQMCTTNDRRISQLEELRVTDLRRMTKIERHFSQAFPRVREPSKSQPHIEDEDKDK